MKIESCHIYNNKYQLSNKEIYKNNKNKASFSGHIGLERINNRFILQETAFFRDYPTKMAAIRYIKDNFINKDKINILVGGCSTGEEAVTLSMMTDFIKDKVHITGIDIGEKAIAKANSRKYTFQNLTSKDGQDYNRAAFQDSFLVFPADKPLNEEQKIQKKMFNDFFVPMDEPAQTEKLPFKVRALKWILSSLNIIPSSSQKLEAKTYKLKKDKATNCQFINWDILQLDNIINLPKYDAIFFSNSINHFATNNEDMKGDIFGPNTERIATALIPTFKEHLNPEGIVCFGAEDGNSIINKQVLHSIMDRMGFCPIFVANTAYGGRFPTVYKLYS